jgi:hypothetical protein
VIPQLYWLILGVLAVWRVTHLLNAENGPMDVLAKLRRLAGDSFWGGVLDCFYCLSLWISALAAVLMANAWRERIALWLALSGGACLLERTTGARYFEDPKE